MAMIAQMSPSKPRRARSPDAISALLPLAGEARGIPKLIHQISPTRDVAPQFRPLTAALRARNPDWEYRLHDDASMEAFIDAHYPPEILALYRTIDPAYGVARADLFRYLLMYEVGGVYLDLKSQFERPLSQLVSPDEAYVLTQWRNAPGEANAGWGSWDALNDIPGGEYQQWHIICAPRHPFLRAVLVNVLTMIASYRPWNHGVGRLGVLTTTGPIPYTRAIHEIRMQHRHRMVRGEDVLSGVYSAVDLHYGMIGRHYSQRTDPVVRRHGVARCIDRGFSIAYGARMAFRRWKNERRRA